MPCLQNIYQVLEQKYVFKNMMVILNALVAQHILFIN